MGNLNQGSGIGCKRPQVPPLIVLLRALGLHDGQIVLYRMRTPSKAFTVYMRMMMNERKKRMVKVSQDERVLGTLTSFKVGTTLPFDKPE